jgi:hypothetical protein
LATRASNPYAGRVGATGDRAPSQGVSPARLIELVDARRQHSTRHYQGTLQRLQRWYDSYRGVWSGRLAQFRNNVTIPFTFAMIQSDVARKVQTSFGSWPVVDFEGYGPDDEARAKKNTILVSAQMRDCGSFIKAVDFFLQADICGTGIARIGWKQLRRMNQYRRMEAIAPGLSVPVLHREMATLFDGPTWEPVDRLDFSPQPGKNRIEDMAWVCHRYYADYDDLVDDANSDMPYFDRAGVAQLKSFPMDSVAAGEMAQRRVSYRNEYDYQARQSERFSKPVEIVEMHGLVPREYALPNGTRHVCIAIGNGRAVLKYRESFLGNQLLPFLGYSPMPDPYSFDGVAKTEIAYGPQMTANRLANQKLDALDFLIDPMIVASSSSGINTQNLFTRAGKVILVDGNADDSQIRPLSPDMRGVQAAYTEIGQLFNMMQLGTGETETLLGGMSGSSRETARGFLGRQENALTRSGLESRLAEAGFIEKLADMFRTMDRRWLPMPMEIKILGSMSTINPDTGFPYEPESVTVDYDDLAPDYRARAIGASQMTGRSVRQQNLIGLLQVLSANPAMMQLVNWGNFARQAFDLFDFKNVNELLLQKNAAVNQMAQENGQNPEDIAAAVTQPLQNLSPETLGQLMQVGNTSPLPQ